MSEVCAFVRTSLSSSNEILFFEANHESTTTSITGNVALTLQCAGGTKITGIDFASYGHPVGKCGALSTHQAVGASACHLDLRAEIEGQCLGEEVCTVGKSLLNETLKQFMNTSAEDSNCDADSETRLYVQARCDCADGPSTDGRCRCPCEDAETVQGLSLSVSATVLSFSKPFRDTISEAWKKNEHTVASRATQTEEVWLVVSKGGGAACVAPTEDGLEAGAPCSTGPAQAETLSIVAPSSLPLRADVTFVTSNFGDLQRSDEIIVELRIGADRAKVVYAHTVSVADIMSRVDPCGHPEATNGAGAPLLSETVDDANGRFNFEISAANPTAAFDCSARAFEESETVETPGFIEVVISGEEGCVPKADRYCRTADSVHAEEDHFKDISGSVSGTGEAPVLVFGSSLDSANHTGADPKSSTPYRLHGFHPTQMFTANRRHLSQSDPFGCVDYNTLGLDLSNVQECWSRKCQGDATSQGVGEYPFGPESSIFRGPRARAVASISSSSQARKFDSDDSEEFRKCPFVDDQGADVNGSAVSGFCTKVDVRHIQADSESSGG
jgi:hypothetical protein